jgi:HK97 family phage major capsid protein
MDISAIKAKVEALLKEMNDLDVVVSKAVDAEKDAAREAFEAKRAELEAAQEELDLAISKAEKEAKTKALLDRASELSQTQVPANARVAAEAQAKDHDAELRHQEKCFHKYISGGQKMLSGEEFELMQPKSTAFDKGAGGVKLPTSFAIKMFGTSWAKSVGYSDTEIARVFKASTMVSSSDALGGYLVPEDYRASLLSTPVEAPHILPRATVVPSMTGEVTWPKAVQTDANEYGGMTASWINEAASKPQTDTQFTQEKIATHELAMYTEISHTLLRRSAIALEQWIATRGRQVAMDAMDAAFINGDGNGKPLGLLQTTGIRTVGRQTADTVVRKDLVELKYALKPYHRAGAVFVAEDGVIKTLEELEDNEGRPLFTANTATGIFERLAGYPFIATTRNPSLGTEGDVLFADLREYYIPMEQDIVIKRSDDYKFQNNVASIAIFVHVGGKLVQPRTCAVLGDVGAS